MPPKPDLRKLGAVKLDGKPQKAVTEEVNLAPTKTAAQAATVGVPEQAPKQAPEPVAKPAPKVAPAPAPLPKPQASVVTQVQGYEGDAEKAAIESITLEKTVKDWQEENNKPLGDDKLQGTDPKGEKIRRFGDELRKWTIVDAVGDGHCLLHAILDSTSPTYRKLTREDKKAFVNYFRYEIFADKAQESEYFIELTEDHQNEIRDRIFSEKDIDKWLTQDEISIIAELYKVNIFALNYDKRQKPAQQVLYQVFPTELLDEAGEWQNNNRPWIILYNSVEKLSAHFEAVSINGKYLFSFEQLAPVLKKYVVREKATPVCDYKAGDEVWLVGDEYTDEPTHIIIQPVFDDETRVCKYLQIVDKENIIEDTKNDAITLENEKYTDIKSKAMWDGDEEDTYYLAKPWNTSDENAYVFGQTSLEEVSVKEVARKGLDGKPSIPEESEEEEEEEEEEENSNLESAEYVDDRLEALEESILGERTDDKYDIDTPAYMPTTRRAFSKFIEATFKSLKLPPLKEPDFDACLKKGASGQQEVEVYQYQKFIREYMNSESPYRGILVYHGLGSGKTCSAIAASEALFAKNEKKIIVMTPKSLQKNFIRELTFCGFRHYRIENHWIGLEWTGETKLFALNVLGLSGQYLQSKKPAKLWIPDFSKPSNFKTLAPSEQADVRRQVLDAINHNVQFISYNGITTKRLIELATSKVFDNKTIIIDEIHNLIRLMQGNLEYFLQKGVGAWAASRTPEPITTDRWKLLNIDGEKKKYSRGYLFYRLLTDATNSRIIGLSGTPLINFPQELGILANCLHKYINSASATFRSQDMPADKKVIKQLADENPYIDDVRFTEGSGNLTVLFTGLPEGTKKKFSGKEFIGIIREDTVKPFAEIVASFRDELAKNKRKVEFKLAALPLLPIFSEDFREAFVNDSGLLKEGGPDIVLGKRLTGLISYYKGSKVELMPKVTSDVLEFVEMSDFQASAYMEVRGAEVKKELKQKKQAKGKLAPWLGEAEKLDKSTTYKMVSRQTCNFAFLEEIVRPRPKKLGKIELSVEGVDAVDKDIGDGDELAEPVVGEQLTVGDERDAGDEGEAGDEDAEFRQEVAKAEGEEDDEVPAVAAAPVVKTTIDGEMKTKYEAIQALKKQAEAEGKPFKPTPEQNRIINIYKCRLGNTGDYQKDCERVRACLRYFGKDEQTSKSGKRYGKLSLNGELAKYSAKFARMLQRMEESPGSNLVYSQFLSMEGIGIFSICMDINGYVPIEISYNQDTKEAQFNETTLKSLKLGPKGNVKRYIKFTGGEADDVRRMNLALFNCRFSDLPPGLQRPLDDFGWTSDEPDIKTLLLKGALCNTFCITSAGAEGISLRNVRRVHLMEPYWNDVRIAQVKGRAIRICSHIDFPDVADRSVEIYTYLSCFSKKQQMGKEADKEKIDETIRMKDAISTAEAAEAFGPERTEGLQDYTTTSDEQLYLVSFKKRKLIGGMEALMKTAAIDCQLNETENDDVSSCLAIPNGKIGDYLYHPVLEQDLIEGAKALQFRAAEVAPAPIVVPEVTKQTAYKLFTIKDYGEFEARPVIEGNATTGFELYKDTAKVGTAGINSEGRPGQPIRLKKGLKIVS
jgi:hypothetical protein